MKKFMIFLSVVTVFFWIGTAIAVPIIDGTFNTSEWAGYYAAEDTESTDSNFQVGPGYGGQAYDVEYLGLYITSYKVYFGLQTGFDIANGRDWNNSHFDPGDLALDVNNDGTYDYALDFTIPDNGDPSFALYKVTKWKPVEYTTYPNDFSESNPFQMESGTQVLNGSFSGKYNGNALDAYDNRSYVLEGSFERSLLGMYSGGSMTIHWTMQCGNDYLNQTSAPVPEPATMLLFGVGLCGLAFVGRKKLVKEG